MRGRRAPDRPPRRPGRVASGSLEAGPVLSLWRRGVRTPLAPPAGRTAGQVLELTDSGLVLARSDDPAGGPAGAIVWDASRR